MIYTLKYTKSALDQLEKFKIDKTLTKRKKSVHKALKFLQNNPRHPSLQTHKYQTLEGPQGESVFTAYAEQSTPAAYRIFFYYGPNKKEITIFAITPHP